MRLEHVVGDPEEDDTECTAKEAEEEKNKPEV